MNAPANTPSTADAELHAFLSYSHEDRELAVRLQARLQSFAKPWYRLRRLNVFRDDSHLVGGALQASIESALDRAAFLVLLASPASAESEWVTRELAHWFAKAPQRPVLIVQAAGEIAWDDAVNDFDWKVTTALNAALSGRFSAEPRWLDARGVAGKTGPEQRARLESVVADIACSILHLPKDELVGEDAKQHRRLLMLRNLAIAALAVLAIVASAAAVVAYRKNQESERRLNSAFEMGVRSLQSIEELRNLPGAAKVRRALSDGNQRLLRELEPDLADSDRRLISHRTRNTVFDAQEALESANLTRAASLLDQAKAGYQKYPDDYWAIYGLSDVYDRIAHLAAMRGDPEGKGTALTEALRFAKLANEKQPSDDALGGIEVSLDNLAAHYEQIGKLDEAAKGHEESLRIAQQLFSKAPTIERRNDLALSYVMLYDLSLQRQVPDPALLHKASDVLPRADDPEAPQMATTQVEIAIRLAQQKEETNETHALGCDQALSAAKRTLDSATDQASLQLLYARAQLACHAYAVHANLQTKATEYRIAAIRLLQTIVKEHPDYGEARQVLSQVPSDN